MVPMKGYQFEGQGFTLLELLLAVAILSLIGWLSIPALIQNYKKEQVNALTIGLAGWLQEVRSAALKGSSCGVVISTGPITDGDTVASMEKPMPDMPERCAIPNNPFLLPESARGAKYTLGVSSESEPTVVNPERFTFTRRASKYPPTDVLQITIEMANSGPARCIQLNGLFGNLEMGNYSSGNCEITRF